MRLITINAHKKIDMHYLAKMQDEGSDSAYPTLPARIAQWVRALDFKTRGFGFDSQAGQSNNY